MLSPMGDGRLIIETAHSLLPHCSPFLFVDRGEISADENGARGRHCFSGDEAFFRGHFPGDPIVPGVILLELAAQPLICC